MREILTRRTNFIIFWWSTKSGLCCVPLPRTNGQYGMLLWPENYNSICRQDFNEVFIIGPTTDLSIFRDVRTLTVFDPSASTSGYRVPPVSALGNNLSTEKFGPGLIHEPVVEWVYG